MEGVSRVLVDMITHFPWGGTNSIVLFFMLGLLFLVVFLVPKLIWGKYPSEENPPEVPEGVGAWTIRRQALWTRYFHGFWGRYPRDICSYFWLSLVLGALSVLLAVSCLMLLAVTITVVHWIAYSVWLLAFSILVWIPQIPAFLIWCISVVFGGLIYGGRVIITAPATYKIIGICLMIAVVYAFFRSNAWKVTRLWASAKKNKLCPRIRII